MYRTSEEHLFVQLDRIRRRAKQLLEGKSAPCEPDREQFLREAETLAARVDLRMPALVHAFDLSPLGAEVLLCLLAAEYDPFLRTLTRALQREVGRPWLELGTIAELLDLPTARVADLARLFAPHGPLRRWALVRIDQTLGIESPIVSTKVKVTARVAEYLIGDDTLPAGMQLLAPRPVFAESLVSQAVAQAVLGRVRRALLDASPLVVEVTGAAGTGRRFFAEGLAAELKRPLLVVDLAMGKEENSEISLAERLAEARREVRLANALLCLAHWDSLQPADAQPSDETTVSQLSTKPRTIPFPIRRFLDESSGVVILTAEEREPLLERHARAIVHVAVPFPTPSQRSALLQKAVERMDGVIPDVDLATIARRFALDPGRIEVAARGAVELARERRLGTKIAISHAQLVDACRHQLRHDLKSLATRVTASHCWEDLVISDEIYSALHEMISYVRHAAQVYDDWGFGLRHSLPEGVSVLFAGPPGTGKTMCASVVAHELDMELFRVDLSRIVSKWIGETEKNLGKVFDEAQRSNAIILFDEADSLFAKRTEVKSSVDRYANLEVNFLLQRMEAFGGVTILTTNFEDTIDTAFKRRMTFRMQFEKPDADARTLLWRKVFPAEAELAADVDPVLLGQMFEMSGGNIRNAAVRAAFLAASAGKPIDMKTILVAAERESAEMGLLTRAVLRQQHQDEEAPEPLDESEDVSECQGDRWPGARSSPRLVSITHPRRG